MQHSFNLIFLSCFLTYFTAKINMCHKTHIKHLLKCEIWRRSYSLTNLFTDRRPMTFLHTLFSKGNNQGNLRTEFFKLTFDLFCNFQNMRKITVSKLFCCLYNESNTFLNEFFSGRSIKIVERIIKPTIHVFKPVIGNNPKVAKRLKLFAQLLDKGIVALFYLKKHFTTVKLFSLFLIAFKLVINISGHF